MITSDEARQRRWSEIAARVDSVYPVTGIIRYGAGCYQLKREAQGDIQRPFDDCKRGEITKMTNKSISRLIVVAQSTPIEFKSMMTLTYGRYYPKTGDIVKADLSFFTTWLRRNFKTEYLWFLEFQKRGAPHIHILLENDEISPRMRANVGLKWTERQVLSDWFEGFGLDNGAYAREVQKLAGVNCHERIWELIKNNGGARRYVTKYAAKAYQKEVPRNFKAVGRFWGCSQGVRRPGIEVDVTDDEVRAFLKERGHTVADWEILPKYIFNVSTDTKGVDKE